MAYLKLKTNVPEYIEFQYDKPLKGKKTGEYLEVNQFGSLQATYGVKVKGEDYFWSVSEYLFKKLDGRKLQGNTFEITKAEGEGGKTHWVIKDALGNDLPQVATQPQPTPQTPATSDSVASSDTKDMAVKAFLADMANTQKAMLNSLNEIAVDLKYLREMKIEKECAEEGEPYVPSIEEAPSEGGVSIDSIPF